MRQNASAAATRSFCHFAICFPMAGFKFGFAIEGAEAEDTQGEADECSSVPAAPTVEVSIPSGNAEPLGSLQDIRLQTDILIKLRVSIDSFFTAFSALPSA